MSVRRTTIDRVNEARKSSIPTIGRGKPLNARGSEGDLTFRRTSEGLKLYIKANHSWHGIKVGESFDSLEKKINEIKSKVDTLKEFRLPSTYSVTGDFTLDVSGDIVFDADGGQVTIKDGGANHFLFDCDNTALTIYDDTASSDYFKIQVNQYGRTTISTFEDTGLGSAANLILDIHGNIDLNADAGFINFYKGASQMGSIGPFLSGEYQFVLNSDSNMMDNFTIRVYDNGATSLITQDASIGDEEGHLTLDIDGNIELNADGGQVTIKDDSATHFLFDCDNTKMVIYDDTDAADLFSITVAASGASTIATVDDGAAIGHLTLDVDGDIILDAASGITKFYKAGDTDDLCTLTVTTNGFTTIATNDSDGIAGHFKIDADGFIGLDSVGGSIYCYKSGNFIGGLEETLGSNGFEFTIQAAAGLAQNRLYLGCTSAGVGQIKTDSLFGAAAAAHIVIDAGGHVEFDDCGVGFDLVTPTYNASDTDVNFKTGNKQFVTFGNGNIADLNLFFPATSGNFTLLLKQDVFGSRTVTNYKAFDSASNAANGSSTVKFAGGSNPTLTTDANHVDIISFFWDADNEIAYGVASLDFQF